MRLQAILHPAPDTARPVGHRFVAAAVMAMAGLAAAQFAWSQAASPEAIFDMVLHPSPDSITTFTSGAVDPKYNPVRLHAQIIAEASDPAWAPEAEALIRARVTAPLTDNGRTPYLRVTCKATLCEVAAVVAVAGKSPDQMNALTQAYMKADHTLPDVGFASDGSSSMVMDSTNDHPATRLGMLSYYFRKS